MANPSSNDSLGPSLTDPSSSLRVPIGDLGTSSAADSQPLNMAAISRTLSGLLKAAVNPEQPELLIETMLRGKSDELRKVSRDALDGSSDPRARRALRVDEIMSQLDGAWHLGFGVVVGIPENHKELTAELEKFTDDPWFVDRMLESVINRREFAYGIALALRTTCIPEKQLEFRNILGQMIGSSSEFAVRDNLAYLPLALDTESPDTQKLLLRLCNEGSKSFSGNFEVNVVRALSDCRGSAAVDLLEAKVLLTELRGAEMSGQSAIGLRSNMSPEIRKKLHPVIEGGEFKSALALAEIEGERGLGKLWRAVQIRSMYDGRMIREIRARVAVALADVEPELTLKVLRNTDSLSSSRLAFEMNSIVEAAA